MRLLLWFLYAAAAFLPVLTSEEKTIDRPKRESSEKKIVCYYTNWSVYRPGTAKFSPQNINPYLCTHLIYAFGGLSKENALKPFDKYQDIEQGGYAKFNGLKTYNKNLKTMLAIGGWNEGSARFSPLVADAERRRELVKNTVKFLRQNHFDGLDLDWEYPSFRDGGKPRDRDNYATLVQEFREEFERESEKTGRQRLLLTMAVPAGIEYIDKGYDVPRLNKYLDWMNILSYDYHSAFEPSINHHSPLFALEEDDEYNFDAQLNIDYTVKHYIKLGADRNKLVLGIPTYGRSYTLFNPDATDIGSPADGPGEQGEATREKGYLAYYEICERVKSGGWSLENPYPEAMGPYAYKDNQWVGYDDEDIARAKAKYVNDNDLGGIMFWSIDNDDFRGKCHNKAYPLIEAAKEALLASANELVPSSRSESGRSSSKKQESSSKSKSRASRLRTKTTTTTEPTKSKAGGRTTTPLPPTTPDPGSDFVCKDEGFFPHPRDCKKYFWCLDSGPSSLGIVAHQFTCPSGLVFNKISDSCDYARNVICKNKPEASATTTPSTTTTTTTSTTTARTTTIRSRPVITASPPRTTSTTTERYEEEEDEVEEEEDEEDPGTIKELILLIKKLGGVEQLEKQLNLQNSDAKEKIKPSLYTKVLQGRTANRYRGVINEEVPATPRYLSLVRNRPQSGATEEDGPTTRKYQDKDKPKYVTIQRNRSTKRPIDDESEEESEDVQETVKPNKKEESYRSTSRRRPNTDSTTEKEYVTLRRARPQKSEEGVTTTSKYKNLVRSRLTTESPREDEEDEAGEEEEEEGDEEGIISEAEEGDEDHQPEEQQQQQEVEKDESEADKKIKKYSSISRDKKVLTEEEETKVSGLQGSKHENERDSPTTRGTLIEKDYVNNVYKVTSPKYVEIRRTPTPKAAPPANNVNNVNNTPETNVRSQNEVTSDESDIKRSDGHSVQVKYTTEPVRRVSRPIYRSPTTEKAKTESTGESEFRFRGKFRSTTVSTPSVETKPVSRYKTINRKNSERPTLNDEVSPNSFPRREKVLNTATTTSTTPANSFTTEPTRRFQFAPRTKPTILSPKPVQTTAETFTITVPDIPTLPLTENNLDLKYISGAFPSVTLEPTTTETIDEEPENELQKTLSGTVPSFARLYPPTTSTETTVVTSITEETYTERKRILVPKNRLKYDFDFKFSVRDSSATETYPKSTKSYYKGSGSRTLFRATTQKSGNEKEVRKRGYNSKSVTTTTTTEEPARLESRFVPKKTRSFKKIVSTEAPVTTTTAQSQRARFRPRNKSRLGEQGSEEPLNSLFSRFSNSRKKQSIVKKREDDLDVEQTAAAVYGSAYTNSGQHLLNGGVKQTSGNSYLNSYIQFTTPQSIANYFEGLETTTFPYPGIPKSRLQTPRKPVHQVLKNQKQAKNNGEFLASIDNSNTSDEQTTMYTNTDTDTDTATLKTYIATPHLSSFEIIRTTNERNKSADDVDSSSVEEAATLKDDGVASSKSAENSLRAVAQKSASSHFQADLTVKTRSGVQKPSLTLSNIRALRLQQNNLTNKKFDSGSTTAPPTEFTEINTHPTNFIISVSPTEKHENKTEKNEINSQAGETDAEILKKPIVSAGVLPNFRNFRKNVQKSRNQTQVGDTGRPEIAAITGDPRETKSKFPKGRFRGFVSTENSAGQKSREISSREPNAAEDLLSTNLISTNFRNFRLRQTGRLVDSRNATGNNSQPIRNRTRINSVDETKLGKLGNGGFAPDNATADTQQKSFRTVKIKEGFPSNQQSDEINELTRTRVPFAISTRLSQEPIVVTTFKPNQSFRTLKKGSKAAATEALKTKSSLFNGRNKSRFSVPEDIQAAEDVFASEDDPAEDYFTDPSVGTTYGLKIGVTVGLDANLASTESTLKQFKSSRAHAKQDSSSLATNSLLDSSPKFTNVHTVTSKPPANAFSSVDPKKVNFRSRAKQIDDKRSALPEESDENNVLPNQSNVALLRNRLRQTEPVSSTTSEPITNNIIPSNPSRTNFRVGTKKFRKLNVSAETTGASTETGEPENDSAGFTENGNEVSVRLRPVQRQDGEDENESSEAPPTSRPFPVRHRSPNVIRSRVRSTTSAPSTERSERRRTPLDRRRFQQDSRSTTSKTTEVQSASDTPAATSRANILLRRRIRPSTSTTPTTTIVTTEESFGELQEDSNLEESKSLDDVPDIQDLADPAVVAIHTLATVSPGPISSPGRPSSSYFPPDTYTVHVTPGDIESITPGRITPIAPGTSRPTSILTLKPFTIPVITKQETPKQSPIPIRTSSPFRGSAITLVTDEPYVPRSELADPVRRLEASPRPITSVTTTVAPQRATQVKSTRAKPFSKVLKQDAVQSVSSPEPPADYEYYDEVEDPLANIPASALKVKVHSNGYIECLDRGNFPHPFSCKKFISCAKMENNELLGWEYTCPKHLSFDPVGGICNWSAGLGCQH